MNNRYIEVMQFGHNNLVVKCINNNITVHEWSTDNYLAVGVIAQLWIEFNLTNEEMEKQLEYIL